MMHTRYTVPAEVLYRLFGFGNSFVVWSLKCIAWYGVEKVITEEAYIVPN